MRRTLLSAAALVALSFTQFAQARVTRFVVEERVPFAAGTQWGTAGEYERLKGTAYMEVDPRDPRNAVIVNLDRAPLNARGMVEFSSPFLILKPVDMNRGNRKIWYGINNRGNCIELGYRSFPQVATNCNPLTAADVGESNILLRQGYAVVDAGWHGDVPPSATQLGPNFPVARQADGSPIVGYERLELSFQSTATFTQSLVPGFVPEETASMNTADSLLTVRDRPSDPRVPIGADRWAFGRCENGPSSLQPTTTDLCLFEGFAPHKVYELIYPAKDPKVMGLAYAVTRDIGSYLRYQTQDDAGNANPLALSASSTGIRRAYSSGTSSTGMYQRDFLYLGFNEDESWRKVFDGVTIYSAGTHRLFANVQFAHPTYFTGQDQHKDYTSNSVPPLTFAVRTDDRTTRVRDGILKRPATDPLVFQIDEEMTFWQWKASFNVIDTRGRRVHIPDNVRLYFQNGFGHIVGSGLLSPPTMAPDNRGGICRNLRQGGGGSLTPRALAIAMDEWVDRGIEPPRSIYPGLRPDTLVTLAQYRNEFPNIPGLAPPSVLNTLDVINFGPLFDSTGGLQTWLPPVIERSYEPLVPRPDADGVGVGGIETILTRAPLGTNTGWNIRTGFREPDLCSLSGSYVPFARTRAERLANGDQRLSLQERYRTHEGFVRAVRQAGRQLVRERFMLQEDADAFTRAAEASDVLR
jgi:hypothetical protein